MFEELQASLGLLKQQVHRDCEDISVKIEHIMNTELLSFDKISQMTSAEWLIN